MSTFNSSEGEVPNVDLNKMENISSLVTTFEDKDLITRNVLTYYFDKKTDYVFIDFWSYVNGKPVADNLVGFDKDKVISLCENIINFFKR